MAGLRRRPVEGEPRITITVSWEILIGIRMNGVGFSGTVGTGWGGDFPNSMPYKLVGGDRSGDMREPFVLIVGPMILRVGLVNGRRFCSGPMIRLFSPTAVAVAAYDLKPYDLKHTNGSK